MGMAYFLANSYLVWHIQFRISEILIASEYIGLEGLKFGMKRILNNERVSIF